MKSIYAFLDVDTDFVPTMLHTEVNIARTPKNIALERGMHFIAESLRKFGFDKLVHAIRKIGLPDMVRRMNTKKEQGEKSQEIPNRAQLAQHFKDDTEWISHLLKRDLINEWQ